MRSLQPPFSASFDDLALQPFPIEEIAALGFDPEANLPE